MTYFFDRSLGKRLPQVFKARGIAAITHDDLFAQATADVTWLQIAGERGWIAITKDDPIRHNTNERRALIENAVGCFVLANANASGAQMEQALSLAWEGIEQIVRDEAQPFLYIISLDGQLRRVSLS